jgi:hypothetical protein
MSAEEEINVIVIEVNRAFAEKVHANPGGLRVWLHGANGMPRTEMPAGIWLGTAVYKDIAGQRVGTYRMPTAERVYPKKASVG